MELMEKYEKLDESFTDVPNLEISGPSFDQRYEEFFPSTVPCPSCRGNGKIPKALEKNVHVLVIPLHDERLKPKRTVLYMAISVFLCMSIGGLAAFFLVSRNIEMSSNLTAKYCNPVILIDRIENEMNLTLMAHFNFTNWNYIPVTISNLNVLVYMDIYQGGINVNTTKINVHMRQKKEHHVKVVINFKGTAFNDEFISYCRWRIWPTYYQMIFSANATAQYFAHTEELSLVSYPFIQCNPFYGLS